MLFNETKYTKWYWVIIKNSKLRKLPNDTYREKHHVIPRSLGGNNDAENLTELTAREHFICHLLLTKMTDGPAKASMCYAAWQMSNINNRPRYSPTSRVYEILRRQLSESYKGRIFTEETKRKIGDKSKGRKPMLGKTHTEATKRKISQSKIGVPTPKSTETRRRMSETWKKISPNRAGELNPMFGKTQKDETKKLISKTNSGKNNGMYGKYKNSPNVRCPHCDKSGKDGPNFKRWHFDNCKEKR